MPRTAFVTGANGFLGLNLVEELLAQDWRVIALHRAGSDIRYLQRMPAERAGGDVTDRDSLLRALPGGVDAVFHVAGDTGLWSRNNAQQDRVNVEGTRNMVAAAMARGAKRFLHTSTVSAYGLQRGRIDESAQQLGRISPVNYQRSKFLAEEEVRAGIARGLDAVILNPGAIMGAYDTHNYARVTMLVVAGTLPGVPPGSLPFCHVREVAKAHIAAFERGRKGENYLLGGAMSHLTGREPRLTPEAARMVTREMSCDCAKAVRELGFRPVPLHEMVADCVDWLASEGLLPGVQSARRIPS